MSDFHTSSWEFIKVAPGLASLILLVADRWVRETPTAYITADPLVLGGSQMTPVLHVTNNADAPIAIEWSNEKVPNVFSAMTENSTTEVVQMWTRKTTRMFIEARDSAVVQLVEPSSYADAAQDAVFEFTLEWRRVNPTLYKGRRRLRRTIRKTDYDHMTKRDYS